MSDNTTSSRYKSGAQTIKLGGVEFADYIITPDGEVWDLKYNKAVEPRYGTSRTVALRADNRRCVYPTIGRVLLETFNGPAPPGHKAYHDGSDSYTLDNYSYGPVSLRTFEKPRELMAKKYCILALLKHTNISKHVIAQAFEVSHRSINTHLKSKPKYPEQFNDLVEKFGDPTS